jgi:hypothetical protein
VEPPQGSQRRLQQELEHDGKDNWQDDLSRAVKGGEDCQHK